MERLNWPKPAEVRGPAVSGGETSPGDWPKGRPETPTPLGGPAAEALGVGPRARPGTTTGVTKCGASVSSSAAAGAAGGAGRGRGGQVGARLNPGGEGTGAPNAEMKGRKGERRESTVTSPDEVADDGQAGAVRDEARVAALQEMRGATVGAMSDTPPARAATPAMRPRAQGGILPIHRQRRARRPAPGGPAGSRTPTLVHRRSRAVAAGLGPWEGRDPGGPRGAPRRCRRPRRGSSRPHTTGRRGEGGRRRGR